MARFIIQGQRQLRGTFRPAGNKNAALPMLAACLLTDETLTLNNIPLIEDVYSMLEILRTLGVTVALRGHSLRLCAAGVRKRQLSRELCERVRSSILFAGPLAARHGRAILYPPGGDVIGRRRLDTHFLGLQALGIEISGHERYLFRRRQLQGANLLLDEASVTATENILMAAVLARGPTTIFNAACEPHVQDLCLLLNKMGAQISGIGTNRLSIVGVERLHGAQHTVVADHVEIGSLLAAAAVTQGELIIEQATPELLAPILGALRALGLRPKFQEGALHLAGHHPLRVRPDFDQAIPKIEDGPWPAFPSDLLSVAIVIGTQAQGTTLFFEKMFESRLFFVDRLISMGARIILCDPHRVVVAGATRLRALHMSSPDIRAGMALLIAALCAKGQSIIENAQVIDRGYEKVDQRLRALGADITRKK
ncbi:MAG: UDP-N-acetylglucosamine 1-carboxyvinyltransferase [Lentisphaerae bacterium]|nr:UDP-N-acetylglucosamine 1-carboxyvinyltransferase [Lentisphaerota bacterium]